MSPTTPLWSLSKTRSIQIGRTLDTTLQVNLCQKLLFLYQLIHNVTTDCSLFMKIVSSEYLQNMLFLFWHLEQFWYTTCPADVVNFWKRFTCTYVPELTSDKFSWKRTLVQCHCWIGHKKEKKNSVSIFPHPFLI